MASIKVEFDGFDGAKLAGRLDSPDGAISAYALFAHCFTCSKDLKAVSRIAKELNEEGIAVLRFDFTGLGASEGEFASTNFTSNVEDLIRAAQFLKENYQAPQILIGHSLGGAAILSAASELPEVKAIATIGAPADVEHVSHNFQDHIEEIKESGAAEVSLQGRKFTIKKQFLLDIKQQRLTDKISRLKQAIMVMHAPLDSFVSIDNASQIFLAAKHPKSFVSLDKADHLLTKAQDAAYVARTIAAWASHYIERLEAQSTTKDLQAKETIARETGQGKFQNSVTSGAFHYLADEPKNVGGDNTGPAPYDFLNMALATCTSMTLRIYAGFKKLDLGRISVTVTHDKIHAKDCETCLDEEKSKEGKIDQFIRTIHVEGDVDEALKQKLLEIADKCPVHKTLHATNDIVTKVQT